MFSLSSLGWSETDSTWYMGRCLTYSIRLRRWIMISVEQSVECLAGETEVLGENLPKCCFVHYKSPRLEPGPPSWEAGD
jgi:hypothetical protein